MDPTVVTVSSLGGLAKGAPGPVRSTESGCWRGFIVKEGNGSELELEAVMFVGFGMRGFVEDGSVLEVVKACRDDVLQIL